MPVRCRCGMILTTSDGCVHKEIASIDFRASYRNEIEGCKCVCSYKDINAICVAVCLSWKVLRGDCLTRWNFE